MNLEIEVPPVGGLSTQIHMALCIISQNISNIYDIKKFKIKLTSELFNTDLFEHIYHYDSDCDYIKLSNEDITTTYMKYIDLYEWSKSFKEANYLLNLNKLKSNIFSKINDYVVGKNINENTLGLHIRLTDMNVIHGSQHGSKTYEDFIKKVMEVLQKNRNINNIFISSDNHESILKVCSDLPDIEINYISEFVRCEKEDSDNLQLQIENLKDNNYCINTFIEIYLLSKCGYLVHRISGYSLCSILYSNTLKKTYLI